MRFVLFVLVALAAACTKPNPNTCCTTEAQCAALGASELRPCDVGQACGTDFQCVAAECATSAECPSDRPICQNELCVGACTSNDDCADVAGRSECASDGVCVGCVDSSQCSGTTAICDPQDRSCRGCERDSECPGGVCIEADGRCVVDSQVVFLSSTGTDGGCTRGQPCRTLAHAVAQLGERFVVHVTGGSFDLGSGATISHPALVIDGTGTRLNYSSQATALAVEGALTLESVTMSLRNAGTVHVRNGGSLRAFDVEFVSDYGNSINVDSGTLIFDEVRLDSPQGLGFGMSCQSGQVRIERSDVERFGISTTNCITTLARTRFKDSYLSLTGSSTVENNLIVQSYELEDAVAIFGGPSTVRFNTIVNTSTVTADGVALYCDATTHVTSNVFAYNSTNPINGPGCTAEFSLFDDAANADAGTNLIVPATAVFVDRGSGDYRLPVASPGLDAGEPGLVDVDLSGNARPSPVGTAPDIGAYEAP